MKAKLALVVVAKLQLWVQLCGGFTHQDTYEQPRNGVYSLGGQSITILNGTMGTTVSPHYPRRESEDLETKAARLRQEADDSAKIAASLKRCEKTEDELIAAMDKFKKFEELE